MLIDFQMKAARIYCIVLSAVLLLYTAYRAANISVVYDESMTYFSFVNAPVKDVVKYNFVTANNHLLNSLLIKAAVKTLPASAFVIRLPNLLAHLVFLFFSFQFCRAYKPSILQACFFTFLNINPFLLDFFSLARGYGLSVAFTMASLYYLQQFLQIQTPKLRNTLLVLLMAALAVLANFSLLNFYCSLLAVIGLYLLLFPGISAKTRVRNGGAALVFSLLLFAYVVPIGLKLKKANELFFGGTSGFWKDTVYSLVKAFLYNKAYAPQAEIIVQGIIVLALFTALILIAYKLLSKNALQNFTDGKNLVLPALFLLLLISAGSTIVQFYLLGTKFLIERTALFFIPLFGVFFCELLYRLYISRKEVKYAIFSIYILAFFHLLACINFKYVLIWRDDCNTMIADLKEKVKAGENKDPVALQVSWMYAGTLNFYRITRNYTWLQDVKIIDATYYKQADYVYVDNSTFNTLDTNRLTVINTYPESHSLLAQPIGKEK